MAIYIDRQNDTITTLSDSFSIVADNCAIMTNQIKLLFERLDELSHEVHSMQSDKQLRSETSVNSESPNQKRHLEILAEKVENKWFQDFLKEFYNETNNETM